MQAISMMHAKTLQDSQVVGSPLTCHPATSSNAPGLVTEFATTNVVKRMHAMREQPSSTFRSIGDIRILAVLDIWHFNARAIYEHIRFVAHERELV